MTIGMQVDGNQLRLSGDLVFETVEKVSLKEFGEPVDEIDLSDVERVDSGGIALFVWLQQHFSRSGRPCRLTGVSPTVAQLFEVGGLGNLSNQ